MKPAEIRLHILDILEEAKPFAVPEETLLRNLNARVRPEVKRVAFDDHVLFLKKAALIAPMKGKLTDVGVRWLITEAGQAERMR